MDVSEGVRGTVVGTRCAEDGHLVMTLDVAALAFDLGDDVTIYPGHTPRYTEAEWQEKQREQRPQAEVIERARAALDYVAFGQAHNGCGFEKVQIIRDLLAYAEAAPQDARTPIPPEVLAELEEAGTPHAGARPKDYMTTEALHPRRRGADAGGAGGGASRGYH